MVTISEQGFSVRLSARIDGYLAAMDAAKKATKDVAAAGGVDMQRLGGKMQDVGLTVSKGVTLPLIAAGGIAIKMSSDFETSFQRMIGLAGVTADEVDGLKKSVLDLAGQTAKSPQELADALYEASSAGLNTAQAMDAVTVAAKASAVGMGSAKDIVGLVASATAAYGSSNITAARATDILTASIRAGRADPTELAGTLGRVLPIANQLGVSFEQVGGATAYLSNVFGDTNRTVTALQGFLIKLVSPTAQGRKALEDMGTSVAELKAAIDKDGLLGALDLLKTHGFQDNAQAMAQLFDDIEGRQGALALMADESGNLATVMGQVKDSAGSLDEAFKGVTDTAGFKMKQAWADVQVAMIKAGDIILPIASGVAGAIGNLASMFSELPGPVQTIVVALIGLAAAAGPVLIVAGTMVKNFNLVKTALGDMSGAASKASLALGAIGVIVGVATLLYSENQKRKQALTTATDTFVTALKAEADGQQGAVKAQIAALITNKDMIATAKEFNLTSDDLADIIAGKQVPAYDKMKASLGGAVNDYKAATDSTDKLRQEGQHLARDLDTLAQGFSNAKEQAALAAKVNEDLGISHERTAEEVKKQTAAFNDLRDITDVVKDSTVALTKELPLTDEQIKANAEAAKLNADATKEMAKALDRSVSSFDLLAGAASLLKKALDAVFGGAQSLEDANRTLEAAVASTTQSINDNGKTLDIHTEKGRKNREAIEAQANAALNVGVAMVGMGHSHEEATAAIDAQIVALHDQLIATGLTEEQVADYIKTLGLTPDNVDTAITLADTEATKLRIKDLQDRLGDIDAGAAASITADIEQGKFDAAESKLLWISRTRDVMLNLTPGSGLKLIFGEGQTPLIRWGYAAAGSFVPGKAGGTPLITGEAGDEAVMPLTNQSRLRALLSDSRIGAPISAAMLGLHGNGGASSATAGPVVNKTIQFGDINNTVDFDAAWRMANFHLAAA